VFGRSLARGELAETMADKGLQQGQAMPDSRPIEPGRPDAPLIDDWHVVGFSSEVADGKVAGARLLGEELVIWRHAGKAHVWKDLCIHRGSRLSKGRVVDGTIACPYHGWRYDRDAKCVLVPAHPDIAPPRKARAFPHRVEERYGFIWASLGNPAHDVPAFAETNQAEFRLFHAGPYHFRANVFRSVENFIDATHFPFVHPGMNGVLSTPDKLEDYVVFPGPPHEGPRTGPVRVFQPYGDHREIPVHAEYHYRCLRPTTAFFRKYVRIADPAQAHRGSDKDCFVMMLTAQPLDEMNCIIRLGVAINYGPELTEADIRRRQDVVFAQDRDIVETQRPELIPLDLREELHMRSDKFAVAYRRWLREVGITYGTQDA
jgi:phenylpropionate dioxygenase-like ring-hydroxylating dioxygenase large terminal subunit